MKDVFFAKNQGSGKNKQAVIIGSGIAGMATAIRLAVQGMDVSIYEANDSAGGKMSEWRKDDFRFDIGPSVFTMAKYVEELFQLAGKATEDYVEILRPELPFNYFFDDGIVLNFYADLEKLVDELASKTIDNKKTIQHFLDDIATKYRLTDKVFLQQSLHIISNYWSKEVVKGVLNFHKVEVFRSMDDANKRNFKDHHTRRLFNAFASYMGSNPYKAPGVLNVIAHFQLNTGIFFPVGGMYAISKALVRLATELGVRIHLNTRVDQIMVQNKKAVGIKVGDQLIRGDYIISNADVNNTYKYLLADQKHPRIFLDRQKSHSALVFLLGIKGTFPQLTLHNMLLSEDMESEYDTIFNNGDIGDDFSIYLYVSSKCNPTDAPPGHENWYILINAPHLQGQDWESIIKKVRKRLIERLSHILGQDIEPLIVLERVQDPRTFEQHTRTALGAIYGNSFNGTFSVFLRHPNFSQQIKNLYFCGGTVHPGAGVPLSILSGKIVAELIRKKVAAKKPLSRVS